MTTVHKTHVRWIGPWQIIDHGSALVVKIVVELVTGQSLLTTQVSGAGAISTLTAGKSQVSTLIAGKSTLV